MRRPCLADLLAAADWLAAHPGARAEVLFARAHLADAARKRSRRPHPLWGNGSLCAAARAESLPPAPPLHDRRFLRALAEIVAAEEARLARHDARDKRRQTEARDENLLCERNLGSAAR